MNEISSEVNTRVIIFHDGGKKFITDEQYKFIMLAKEVGKSIDTPKLGFITLSSIARIPTIEEFYEQFPKERPEHTRDSFQEHYGGINQQIRKPTVRAKELMKQGFIKGYMETWGGTQEHAEKKFEQIILKGPMDNTVYHRKTVEKYREKTDLNPSEKEHYEHALSMVGEKV